LQVPTSALFRHGDGWSVFVIEQGRARQRDVRVDHRGTFETEIVQGLNEGDVVVRNPSDRIADGLRVAVAPR
jgi:HlyD family secretion protein